MAFIAGKGFAILNSKAEKGDQKAKDLLAKLNTIDQDEADRLFSEILGKGGGGGAKKEKKIKAPGASATDGQGEITEGAGEQAPTGKATPKAKGEAPIAAPDAPTGEVKPKAKRKTEDLSNTIRFFLDKKPKLSEFETEAIAKEYGVSVKKVKENISQVLQTKYDETEKDNKAEIARTQEQEPTGEVKPKAKNVDLSSVGNKSFAPTKRTKIEALAKKLVDEGEYSEEDIADILQDNFGLRNKEDESYKDIVKAYGGKNKKQKQAPEGKVTPTAAPAEQPKTTMETLQQLNKFGIPTGTIATKAAELDKAGIEGKEFISEMMKLTEGKEPLKRGGKNAKAFVQKFTQDKPYFQDEYQQEEIGTAYELLNGDERLTEAAAVAGSQFQVSPAFIKDNKLVVPYGDGDFEFAEGDYFTQDRENRLNIIDLDKFAQSQGIGGGSAAPAAESNVPSQFKDGNDAAKFGVFMSVKDAIDDDLDFDENEIKQIANEYGVSTKEVSQIIRGYQKRKQGGTQIDTAGANPAPAGAFGDIEPETQQLAGIGPIEKLQYKNPENAEGFKKEMSALVDRIKNLRPLTEEDAEQLGLAYDLTPDEIDKAMREIGAKEKAAAPAADQEVADELGVDTEQLNELLKPTNTNNPKDPEDPANVQQVLNSVGGDKAKALQIIKGQQAVNGGLQLNEKTIKEVINQVAAGETNPSLPVSAETQAEVATMEEADKKQARQRIDDIMQQGRGGVSLEEAEALSEEFGIPVDEIRALERKSQSEIAFPAPDQGEAIPADQDFDAQGNPLGNPGQDVINRIKNPNPDDAEIYDAIKDEIRMSLFESGEFTEQETAYFANEYGITEEEVTELANQEKKTYAPRRSDEQKTLGPISSSQQTEKLTPEKLNATLNESNKKDFINALTAQGLSEKEANGFYDNSYGPDREGNVGYYYTLKEALGDVQSVLGEEEFNYKKAIAEQPATFEVADENNLTPDEFQRMDFEAGEAQQPADTDEFENDNERIGGQGFVRLSNNINFDRSIITDEQIQQVAQDLGLEGKTPEQLTQIRNGVVKEAAGRQNPKAMTAMSAITAAIDSYIMGSNRNKPAAKPAQAQSQIKQTANANAQQATPQAPAKAAAQPQQQPGKIDRKKLEAAAADLGVDANLLEGLLELLKKVR
jgi:hypothetical protein